MAGRLKPLDVERQTKPGKYADGDGLYLIVTGPTSKSWSYRYWKDGKERWHGLGSLKDVSLKDARLARDAARLRVKGDRSTAGVDIMQERQKAREEAKAVEAKVVLPTFEECAEANIRANWSAWSEKHREPWPSSLKRYAYPTIGKLTILEIKPSHIHDLLKPIWVEKRETANRVRGLIETIVAKNVDIDDPDFRNPAELTRQLREKLPKRPKRVIRHHAALPYADAPTFMKLLAGAPGTAAAMLRFLIFTACRTNEAVEGRWSEIDLPSSTWKIPSERMKMDQDQDHHVPLTDPALAVLDEMRDGRQGELIFTNPDGRAFSENAMLSVLDRLGYGALQPPSSAFQNSTAVDLPKSDYQSFEFAKRVISRPRKRGFSSGPGCYTHGHAARDLLKNRSPLWGAAARFLPRRPPRHGDVRRWHNESVF